MKKTCHYEVFSFPEETVSVKGYFLKNLLFSKVPSREKHEKLLKMTKV